MLRLAIFAMVGLLAAGGLLLFDDIGRGLPIINLAIWAVLIVTGGLVALRASRRRQRRARRTRRSRSIAPQATEAPPRLLVAERPSTPELPRR